MFLDRVPPDLAVSVIDQQDWFEREACARQSILSKGVELCKAFRSARVAARAFQTLYVYPISPREPNVLSHDVQGLINMTPVCSKST
jgi:hypothetical protein